MRRLLRQTGSTRTQTSCIPRQLLSSLGISLDDGVRAGAVCNQIQDLMQRPPLPRSCRKEGKGARANASTQLCSRNGTNMLQVLVSSIAQTHPPVVLMDVYFALWSSRPTAVVLCCSETADRNERNCQSSTHRAAHLAAISANNKSPQQCSLKRLPAQCDRSFGGGRQEVTEARVLIPQMC